MSHKTLYIDVDEEITSIIDRVRKSAANDIIVVAPKQAMLLQSLVNLKLLKKETDRRKKKLMIVTQDKVGKKLIEKAGILVQGKMDRTLEEDREAERNFSPSPMSRARNGELIKEAAGEELKIGSDQYFDEPIAPVGVSKEPEKAGNIGKISFQENMEKPAQKGEKPAKRKKEKNRLVKISDIVAGPKAEEEKKIKAPEIPLAEIGKKEPVPASKAPARPKKFGRDIQRKAERFFGELKGGAGNQAGVFRSGKKEKIMSSGRVGKRTTRYFLVFAVAAVVLAGLAGVYFILPRATVAVYLNNQQKSSSADIEANVDAKSADVASGVVPATLEQLVKEKTEEFTPSGSQSGAGKAKGSVVIYNEFSSDSQPLVATTRLQTPDGKIFRITKAVVVPGTTKVGAETKPGAIETEVEADKPGDSYNIDPATFKIPGFEGGPKYDKFYAKSAKPMAGGGESGALAITSQDVAQAKEKMIADAKKDAIEELKNSLGAERKFFEDAITTELVSATPSASVGTETDKFSYSVKVRAKTLSFSESDVKEILAKKSASAGEGVSRSDFSGSPTYVLTAADPGNKYLKFQAKADLNVSSSLDVDNFKKGMLGKTAGELEAIAKNYSSIKSVEVKFWPFFVTRVPMDEKKVKVEIK